VKIRSSNTGVKTHHHQANALQKEFFMYIMLVVLFINSGATYLNKVASADDDWKNIITRQKQEKYETISIPNECNPIHPIKVS
jgi:hypothetical protein